MCLRIYLLCGKCVCMNCGGFGGSAAWVWWCVLCGEYFVSFSVAGIYCMLRNSKVHKRNNKGSMMCRYLTTNDLIYDQMK